MDPKDLLHRKDWSFAVPVASSELVLMVVMLMLSKDRGTGAERARKLNGHIQFLRTLLQH